MVSQMVAKEPDDRFQSMNELIDRIKELRPTIAALDLSASTRSQETADAPEGAQARGRLSRNRLILAFALLLPIAAAAAFFLATAREAEEKPKAKPTERLIPKETILDPHFDSMSAFGSTYLNTTFVAGRNNVTASLKQEVREKRSFLGVTIIDAPITLEDIALIGKLKPSNLNLRGCTGITDATVAAISKIPTLRYINLDLAKGLSPEGIARLRYLPVLATLCMKECDLTNRHLKAIKNFPSLRYIQVDQNTRLTIDGVSSLSRNDTAVNVVVDERLINSESIMAMRARNIILIRPQSVQQDQAANILTDFGTKNPYLEDFGKPAGSGSSTRGGDESDKSLDDFLSRHFR
jgi:hypothetical protein